MPAIFPAELTSKQDAGRRGVLHTIWARRRLAELQAEIEAEMRTNGESVGLEMAIQERQWLIDHFGLAPDQETQQPAKLHIPQSTPAPTSPRSPVGGRLGEKLKGLKLATSPAELAAASQGESDHTSRSLFSRERRADCSGMGMAPEASAERHDTDYLTFEQLQGTPKPQERSRQSRPYRPLLVGRHRRAVALPL